MFCPRCGLPLPDGSSFCPRCGLPFQNYNQAQNPNGQPPQGGQYLPGWGPDPNYYPPQQNLPPYGYWGQGQGPNPQWPGAMPPRQIPQVGPGGHVYKDGVPLDERETRSAWEQPDTPVNTPPPAQDADPNFTKFVDAPDEPLPFYALKMIAGIVLIIGGGFLLYQSAQLGTFRLLALHAKDNIRGFPVMLAGIAWLVAGIAGFFSKFKKGAAGLAGCMLLFAAGIGFSFMKEYEMLMIAAIVSALLSIIYLISAAGGVNINLND